MNELGSLATRGAIAVAAVLALAGCGVPTVHVGTTTAAKQGKVEVTLAERPANS